MPPAIVGSPGSSRAHPRWEEQNPASNCRAAERTTGSRLDHNGGNHVKFGCPAVWLSAPREHSQTASQSCNRIHTRICCNTYSCSSASAHNGVAIFRVANTHNYCLSVIYLRGHSTVSRREVWGDIQYSSGSHHVLKTESGTFMWYNDLEQLCWSLKPVILLHIHHLYIQWVCVYASITKRATTHLCPTCNLN